MASITGEEAAALAPSSASTSTGKGVGDRLGASVLALFAAPAAPLAALALPLVVYLPHFYATHLGISLTAVGAIFSLVRLIDIGIDPVLGAVIDRTRTRFGRFRPWVAASLPILMLGAWLLFMPPSGAGSAYLTGSLLLLYVGYSMAVIAHLAWGSVLAGSYHERSRVYGWVQAVTVGGMVLVLILPIILAKTMPNGDAAGVASMGWFVILLTPITGLLLVWRVKEPAVVGAGNSAAGFGSYLKVLRRPTVIRILAATIFLALAPGVTGAIFLFFFRQARHFSAADTNILLLVYFVGGLAGAPVWSTLARRIGKHRALIASCGYYVVLQSLILTFPKGSMLVGVPGMFMAGLGFSAYLILLRAMTADACDEARLDLGADCTGMIYALHNVGAKIAGALGVVVTFPLLQRFGFNPTSSQNSAQALHGLELTFVVLPIACVILGGLSLVGYRLTEGRHNDVRDALLKRDEALLA